MKNLVKKCLIFAFLFFLLSIFISSAECAVPRLINYQGKLTDISGVPLNGSYAITFRIYDSDTTGNLLWEETQQVVIDKGIFSLILGSVNPLGLAFDTQYYLEIKVGSEVMSPRQRLTSAGYAIRSEKAETAVKAETADKALTIEARTSDPPSPVAGQMWLRIDL